MADAKVLLLAVPAEEADPSARADGDLERVVEIGFYVRDRWAKEDAVRREGSGRKDGHLRRLIDEAVDTCEPNHFAHLRAEARGALSEYVDRHRSVVSQGDLIKAAQAFHGGLSKDLEDGHNGIVSRLKLPLWRTLGVWTLGAVFGGPLSVLGIVGAFAILSNASTAMREEAVDGIAKVFGVRVTFERRSPLQRPEPEGDKSTTPGASPQGKQSDRGN